jgi:hypothetical protein
VKTLIAIVNARHRADWRNAIRRTWLPQVQGADAFFFVGNGSSMQDDGDDIVKLPCSDAYNDLPAKVKAIASWALDHGYDFMLKCDDDVVLRPTDFLNSGFEQHAYSGRINRPSQHGGAAVPCGFGYVLSRHGMSLVAKSPLPPNFDDEAWVAYIMLAAGIKLFNVPRYEVCQKPRGSGHFGEWFDTQNVASDCFAWCVHLKGGVTQEVKLDEFQWLFDTHGE